MTEWTYGEAGERYPVAPGDVWRVGSHVFVCSDLMESRLLDELLELDPPTLLYCDPPWGQALVQGFRTKAGVGKATYRWEELYHRIAEIGHGYGIPVWIEGSKPESRDGKKIPDTIAHREDRSHDLSIETTYYGKNPSGLYHAGLAPVPTGLADQLRGMDDEDTPGAVMAAYDPGDVVDPCAGQGLTARHAHALGWSSVNNELSPFRMSASLVYQEEATHEEAEKVS